MSFNSTNNSGKSYLDLNGAVCGTLQRIRDVTISGKGGRKGKTYVACTLKAFHGDAKNPNFTYIDLTIPAADALNFVQKQREKVATGLDVFVKAWVGDIRVDSYDRENRVSKQRETASVIKGRLLKIEAISRNDASPAGKYTMQIRGIAYLNQLFAPRSDKPTWMATLSAMHGSIEEMEYTPFQLSVAPDGELGDLLAAFQPTFEENKGQSVEDRKKVTVAFKAENIHSSIYFRKPRDGEQESVAVAQIVGELSEITRIKVGEEVLYRLVKVGEGDNTEYEVETTLPLKTGTDA